MSKTFNLFDLEVTVIGEPHTFACSHQLGYAFRVHGENLLFSSKNLQFSMYTLAALIPLLPAKQRPTELADWMTSDEIIACPDPNCGAQFQIKRVDTALYQAAAS